MATVLEARPDHAGVKAYRHGTHRTVDPTSTLARVQPYFARMGISRIANVTGLDRIGVPVVMRRSLPVPGAGSTVEGR